MHFWQMLLILVSDKITWHTRTFPDQKKKKKVFTKVKIKRYGIDFLRKWQNGTHNLQIIWKQWVWLFFFSLPWKDLDYNTLAVKYDTNKISMQIRTYLLMANFHFAFCLQYYLNWCLLHRFINPPESIFGNFLLCCHHIIPERGKYY